MLLSLEQFVSVRSKRALFAPLNVVLNAGGLIVIKGANGSGKTTLLRTLAGLMPSYQGRITFTNKDVAPLYVAHHDALFADITVHEHIVFWQKLHGQKSGADILGHLNLEQVAHKKAQHISAGQKRRLSLARLLIAPATMWLLDEPQTNLDAEGQNVLSALITQHRQKGGGVMMASHLSETHENAQHIMLQKAAA